MAPREPWADIRRTDPRVTRPEGRAIRAVPTREEAVIKAVRAPEAAIREETIKEGRILADIRAIPAAAREDTKARAAIRVAKAGIKAPAAATKVAIAAVSLMTPIDPDPQVQAVIRAGKVAIKVQVATRAARATTRAVKAATRDKGPIRVADRADTPVPDHRIPLGKVVILHAALAPKAPEPPAAIAPAIPRRGEDLPEGRVTYPVARGRAVMARAARRTVPLPSKAARQPNASRPRGESPGS